MNFLNNLFKRIISFKDSLYTEIKNDVDESVKISSDRKKKVKKPEIINKEIIHDNTNTSS